MTTIKFATRTADLAFATYVEHVVMMLDPCSPRPSDADLRRFYEDGQTAVQAASFIESGHRPAARGGFGRRAA